MKSGLYIKVPSANERAIRLYEKLGFIKTKEIITNFKGDIPVIIVCADDNRRLAAPKSLYVCKNDKLLEKLSSLLGKSNVKLVK